MLHGMIPFSQLQSTYGPKRLADHHFRRSLRFGKVKLTADLGARSSTLWQPSWFVVTISSRRPAVAERALVMASAATPGTIDDILAGPDSDARFVGTPKQ
jgi:hypothetical protein